VVAQVGPPVQGRIAEAAAGPVGGVNRERWCEADRRVAAWRQRRCRLRAPCPRARRGRQAESRSVVPGHPARRSSIRPGGVTVEQRLLLLGEGRSLNVVASSRVKSTCGSGDYARPKWSLGVPRPARSRSFSPMSRTQLCCGKSIRRRCAARWRVTMKSCARRSWLQAAMCSLRGGDAFCASFSRAVHALAAAVGAQELLVSQSWPEPVCLGWLAADCRST
jgi:hypothetical protein